MQLDNRPIKRYFPKKKSRKYRMCLQISFRNLRRIRVCQWPETFSASLRKAARCPPPFGHPQGLTDIILIFYTDISFVGRVSGNYILMLIIERWS